jgi:hypothetical protein
MNSICVKRAEFENNCILNLASRMGKAAAGHWKDGSLQFRVDLSGDANVSNDAKYPGVVLDSRNGNFSPSFLCLLAKRFKDATKGNTTVSVDSFVKIVQRAVEKEGQRGGDVGQFSWTETGNLRRIAAEMDNKTGRVPWKKFVAFCTCYTLPSLASVEELVRMGLMARQLGKPVPRMDGFFGMNKKVFMGTTFWFEEGGGKEGDKVLEGNQAQLVKEAFCTAFSDESGETVNFTELLLAWSCAEGGQELAGAVVPMGFFRACACFGEVGENGRILVKPGSSEADFGPTVGGKGLEDMIKSDYSAPSINYAAELFKSCVGEGGGEGGGRVSYGLVAKAILAEPEGTWGGGYALCDLVGGA